MNESFCLLQRLSSHLKVDNIFTSLNYFQLSEEGFERTCYTKMSERDHFDLVEKLAEESDDLSQRILSALKDW